MAMRFNGDVYPKWAKQKQNPKRSLSERLSPSTPCYSTQDFPGEKPIRNMRPPYIVPLFS
jgi:hypothetical protein